MGAVLAGVGVGVGVDEPPPPSPQPPITSNNGSDRRERWRIDIPLYAPPQRRSSCEGELPKRNYVAGQEKGARIAPDAPLS